MTILPDAEPTSVYRYYDKSGLLLYVGITSRATSRQREHNADKEWWPFVASQQVEHYPTRAAALVRERELIIGFRPPFNRQHNTDHANLRALYMAARDCLPTPKGRPGDLSGVDPKDAYHSVRGKIPLTQIETGNLATFAAPGEFRGLLSTALAKTVEPVLLRIPKKCGILTDVRLFEAQPVLIFAGHRGGITSLREVSLHVKVIRDHPFSARLHEATGKEIVRPGRAA